MTFKWSICKILIILLIRCQLAPSTSRHAAVLPRHLPLLSAPLRPSSRPDDLSRRRFEIWGRVQEGPAPTLARSNLCSDLAG